MIKNRRLEALLYKIWSLFCLTAALCCSWFGLLAFCAALTDGGWLYFFPAGLAVIACAKGKAYVRNPLAYALYHVCKKADQEGGGSDA